MGSVPRVTVATDGDGMGPMGAVTGTGGSEPPGRRGRPDAQPNPRQALVEALAMAVARGAAVGDLELARVAHEALGRLLGLGAGQDAGGTVLDLDSFRQTWNEHGGPHED